MQSASHQEQYNALQDQYSALKRDSTFEAQLAMKRINELLGNLSSAEEKVTKLTEEKNALSGRVSGVDAELADLHKKVGH